MHFHSRNVFENDVCEMVSTCLGLNVLKDCVPTKVMARANHATCTPNYHRNHEFIRSFNPLRPRQNGRHFADDIFRCIFLNENVWVPTKISLKFVLKGPINNIPAMVQIMAWRRPGDKPLSEPMMVSLTTHICVTRPQWVKQTYPWQHQNFSWIISFKELV